MGVVALFTPDLLRQFAAGSDSAFTAVYRRYAGPMFAIALRTCGHRELAAEAVQQAFVQAWRAAATVDVESDLAPWLFTITRRAAIDAWRSERRHQRSHRSGALDTASRPPDEQVPGPSMQSVWETWQVRLALDRLPADERDVMRLAYVERLTHSEIATHLDVPVGTVKSRSHRAYRRLAEMLAHVRDEPATA